MHYIILNTVCYCFPRVPGSRSNVLAHNAEQGLFFHIPSRPAAPVSLAAAGQPS